MRQTLGRQAYHETCWMPSSRKQRHPPESSDPRLSRSLHTRRRGRHCRTGGGWGTCGRQIHRRRKQKGTETLGTVSAFQSWCSSETRKISNTQLIIFPIWFPYTCMDITLVPTALFLFCCLVFSYFNTPSQYLHVRSIKAGKTKHK